MYFRKDSSSFRIMLRDICIPVVYLSEHSCTRSANVMYGVFVITVLKS